MNANKPLGRKNYGSIGHLPESRLGSGDYHIPEGQAKIATEKARDRHDVVIVQEKLDGSNVGVARIGDEIYPLQRAGYLASTSPHEQHRIFDTWARANKARFMSVLRDGERIVGEWLALAHGTIYELQHEPFVAFDIMTGRERLIYDDFEERVKRSFIMPALLSYGPPIDSAEIMRRLGDTGYHGATEPPEGAIWRVERNKKVDFLCKFVRRDKEDGKYLSSVSGDPERWLWKPESESDYFTM